MPASPVTVRRARTADAADMARQMAHPGVYGWLMQLPMPTEEMWRARLERLATPDNADVLFVAEIGGSVVGSAGLHPAAQLRRRHAAHLGISVAPEAQRQGVGRALMAALCDYADNWAHILRQELTVFVDNAGAIELYRRFDFRHEGTHRAFALREGVYVDVHAMARLHPRPPQIGWGAP